MPKIEIINTGVANIRSLQASFDRLQCEWSLTETPETVTSADFLVLPGVGRFAAAAQFLDQQQLREPLRKRIEENKPTLAICLGFQLLCRSSEESPEVEGIGVLPYEIKKFADEVPVPQLGWNTVVPTESGLLVEGDAYFANSYRLLEKPTGWNHATTDYGGRFTSAFWRGRVLACQFHPELSGPWGERLLKNWLEGSSDA